MLKVPFFVRKVRYLMCFLFQSKAVNLCLVDFLVTCV